MASNRNLTRRKWDVRQDLRDGKSTYAPRESHPDPQTLGQLALADRTEIIGDPFLAGSQLDPLDRAILGHASYISYQRNCCFRTCHVGEVDSLATYCADFESESPETTDKHHRVLRTSRELPR